MEIVITEDAVSLALVSEVAIHGVAYKFAMFKEFAYWLGFLDKAA